MNNIKKIAIMLCIGLVFTGFAGCKKVGEPRGNMSDIQQPQPGEVYAFITLKSHKNFEGGEMSFILFEDIAPEGVKKFIHAAEIGYYNNKTFHRVLKDMMVQGGALNLDGSDTSVPQDELFAIETHKNAKNFYGALCFAVDEKSGKNYRQFYIVAASTPVDIDRDEEAIKEQIEVADSIDESMLNDVQQRELAAQKKELQSLRQSIAKIPAAVKERYAEQGGLYRFDGKVTVFGQIVSGHELLKSISAVPVVAGNKLDDDNPGLGGGNGLNSRPADDIFIDTIRIVRIEPEEE